MPTTPYAALQVSLNSGAIQTGGITGAVGDTVDLSAESTVGWATSGAVAPYWGIFGPPDFTVPAGWSTDADSGEFYYRGVTPPQFTLDVWGKYMLRLLVNGGGGAKTDASTAIDVASSGGLKDLGRGETNQFGEGWDDDHRANLRIIETGLGVAKAPADATFLVNSSNGTLTNEVVIGSIGTTLAFASTSTIPCSFSRTDSATNTAVDARKLIAISSSSAANGFGVAELYQAEGAGGTAVDVGRLAFTFTDITGSSEDTKFAVQVRTGGSALANALELTGTSAKLAAIADGTAGYVAIDTAGNLSRGAGGSGAPADANYLVLTANGTLSAETALDAIGTTIPFVSTTTIPASFTRDDASTNTVIDVAEFRRTTSSTAAAGIGGQLKLTAEDAAGNVETAGYLSWRLTTATDSGEASELGLWTRTGGGSLTKHAYLTGAGAWTATSIDSATVTASGGTITVGAGTTSNFGTSSTTNNFGTAGATNTITGDTTNVTTNPSSTNTAVDMFVLTRTTSGTAAAGIGLSQKYQIENASGTTKDAGFFKVTLATATAANETTKFAFWMMGAGGAASEKFYWQYDGNFFGDYVTFSNVFASVTSSGFRFNDAGNRGGLDQDGSNHLRLKSYNSKDIIFYTGADASGVGGTLRLTISSAGLATFTGAVAGPRRYSDPSTPTSASNAVTFNLTTSQNVHHTTTEATTVTISGGTSGQHGVIVISQGATGRTVTMPTNGVGVEYDNTISALTTTGIIDTTALYRTLLAYYILPNGKAYIYARSVNQVP